MRFSGEFSSAVFYGFCRFLHVFESTSLFRSRLENEINRIIVCSLIEVLSCSIHGED